MICLGTISDGRPLFYDATLYEFRLDRAVATLGEVRELDEAGHILWLAPEQRDWMRRINGADLDRCNREALGRHGMEYDQLSPEEQVQADAKRDDSVLAGRLVDADPALVAAVADALEQRGFAPSAAPDAPGATAAVLPEGMEALAQLQKQEGRKMTVLEHYLMRRILKNDDRQKARRERAEEAVQEKAAKDAAKAEEDTDEATGKKSPQKGWRDAFRTRFARGAFGDASAAADTVSG